jgi:predicted nucleic acid-binding protein
MDTNVAIDFLANRQPFSLEAAKLFDLAVKGHIKIYISAISYSNIYYILRQSLGNAQALYSLDGLAEMSEIADVTNDIIRQSLKTNFTDYEDAIQYQCALNIPEIDFIVTRNTKDFKKSILPVLTTLEAVSTLNSIL